ncbi:hypothetical protein FIV04_26475 (plasmid) [Vibrio sp. THAF190c]|nr:hypothetical protein FIV04_26475 [Vibrio sp. THAF190c]
MMTGAMIYIGLCVGFVCLLAVVGWGLVCRFCKKHGIE